MKKCTVSCADCSHFSVCGLNGDAFESLKHQETFSNPIDEETARAPIYMTNAIANGCPHYTEVPK